MPDDLAIHARGVTRVYKAKPEPVTALGGVDLEVEPGEYFWVAHCASFGAESASCA